MKCFKARKPRVKPQNPAAKSPQLEFSDIPIFFLVKGHNARAQGTYNYKGESEYKWHGMGFPTTVAHLEYLCPIIPVFTISRPAVKSYNRQVSSVCKEIKKITKGKPSFGFNGHFNSSRGGTGSEGLAAKGSSDNFDDILADIYTDLLAELGIRQRHSDDPEIDGIKYVKPSHNGAGMILGMGEVGCTTIIGEPCFDYRYFESELIFENPERYFKLIATAVVMTYLRRGIIKEEDIKGDLNAWKAA